MKKNKKGFSLIEVIVATIILSISVFGVFKLIGENTKILSQSQKYLQANLLLQPSVECMQYLLKKNTLDGMKIINEPLYLDVGNSASICEIGDDNTYINLDGINYQIVLERNTIEDNYIDWNLQIIVDATLLRSINFIQK